MATPKVKEDAEILSPEVEEIITTEIETSLVKQNVTEALLSKLEKEYADLKINGQEDKEGYLTVQSARKDCKQVRVLISKICKSGRAKANAEAKLWVNKENTLTERVSKVEDRLEADETAWEEERDRRKQLEAQKLEQQGIERTAHMMGFGAGLQDGNWVLGDISYESILVKSCDPDIYQGIYDQYKAVFDVNEQVKKDREEKDRLEREQFQQQQEQLANAQREAKKMRTEGRISLLESLGMKINDNRQEYVYGRLFVYVSDIEGKEAQDWEVIIAGAREGVEQAKKADKEAERVREVFRERILKLKEWSSNGQSVYANGGIWGKVEDLVGMSEGEFSKLVGENDAYLKERERVKEEQRLKDIEDARIRATSDARFSSLKEIGFTYPFDDLGTMSGENYQSMFDEHNKVYQKRLHDKWVADKAEEKRLADEKEKERLELLGEKRRYEELVASIKAINVPDFKSGQYRSKANVIKSFIEGLK